MFYKQLLWILIQIHDTMPAEVKTHFFTTLAFVLGYTRDQH